MTEPVLVSSAQPLTLSLCMIVKNEAENLARCLASVQGVADELIVVDTGSTDRTLEIAEMFGAKVFHHVWQNDFSLARNVGLEHATGHWILHLDADEELVPETRARVKPLLAETAADGLKVCVRNFGSQRGLLAHFDSRQERLFRNRPAYRYEQPVHELIVNTIVRAGGVVADSDLMIWHYGYLQNEVQGSENRVRRNLKILEQAVAESPEDPGQCARLGFSYYELGEYALAYTYLRRALVELDASHFTTEFMETVLWVLWNVASLQQDHALAAHCVKAILALYPEGQPSVRGLYMAARTCRVEGTHYLQSALSEPLALSESLARLQGAGKRLQQAADYYAQLRSLTQLAGGAMEQIEADWQECQRRLGEAAGYLAAAQRQQAAAETLDRLLEADDILLEVDALGEKLTPDVLILIRLKARTAQAEANPAVAEGFATLADLIEEKLSVAAAYEAGASSRR